MASDNPTPSSVALPPPPALPVIRESNCSQEMTDKAIAYLWEKAPALVSQQLALEPLNFDHTYLTQLKRIIDFLKKNGPEFGELPKTRTGMLDLLFELSRRLRVVGGIPEWEIKGKPLYDPATRPILKLPRTIAEEKPANSIFYVPQDVIDRIINSACMKEPELFYDYAESLRRGGIYGPQIFEEMKALIKKIALPDEKIDTTKIGVIGGEIIIKLRKACGI